MKTIKTCILFLAVLILALPAVAQEGGEAGAPTAEVTYDFADDIVEGSLVRPEGELIEGRQHGGSQSLIDIREHFIDKMIESVDDF